MVELLLAVEGLERHGDVPRAAWVVGHVDHRQQVGPPPGDGRMVADPQVHVQVAGRPAPQAAGAAPGQAQGRALVDAGRDLDHERPLLAPPALAPAVRAGRGDLLPVPPQRGHGVAVTIWPRIDWRTRRTSPAPWQTLQVIGVVPGRAPVPRQVAQVWGRRTVSSRWTPNTASANSRVRAASASSPLRGPLRARGPAGHAAHPAAAAAEEGVEKIAEPAAEPGERIAGAARARPRHAPDAGRAEHVVLAPALRVAEGLVGQVDLLELLLGPAVARVGVGMQLAGPGGGRRA